MVEVGREAGRGRLDTAVLGGWGLAKAAHDDRNVHDWVLLVRRLERGLVGEFLQRLRVVGQPGHHKVVDDPLLLHYYSCVTTSSL